MSHVRIPSGAWRPSSFETRLIGHRKYTHPLGSAFIAHSKKSLRSDLCFSAMTKPAVDLTSEAGLLRGRVIQHVERLSFQRKVVQRLEREGKSTYEERMVLRILCLQD